jgi:nucleoside-diphosphate-sugar epimerase
MRILILGGTGFAGLHQVITALCRGHEVTVFSQDIVDKIDESVELIIGDRYVDLELLRDREWDAVLDYAAFAPLGVRKLAEQLGKNIKHYTLISTVMTYSRSAVQVDEQSPVLEFDGTADPFTLQMPKGWRQYGSLKVLCEREAERQFPGRTLIARPSVISGPGDGVDHIAYWFARMQKGGEILAPGIHSLQFNSSMRAISQSGSSNFPKFYRRSSSLGGQARVSWHHHDRHGVDQRLWVPVFQVLEARGLPWAYQLSMSPQTCFEKRAIT